MSLPILRETRAVCTALGLDPLVLLASGALLVAVAPADVAATLTALQARGSGGRVIGRVTEAFAGLTMAGPAGASALPTFARDELARWFEA